MLEGRPVALPVGPDTDYQPCAQQVDLAWSGRTKGLMLASPANPTGTLLGNETLTSLAATVARRNGTLLVDEIYHGLTYGVDAMSALAISDDIFVINSFSKYFGMTGWRLGWLVAPRRYVREIEKLAQNLYIAPSTVAQHAALAAFRPETTAILEARRQEFSRRRDLLLPGLRKLGFKIAAEPRGAFYIYADSSGLAADSFELAERLLTEAGVAATRARLRQQRCRNATCALPTRSSGERIAEGLAQAWPGFWIRRQIHSHFARHAAKHGTATVRRQRKKKARAESTARACYPPGAAFNPGGLNAGSASVRDGNRWGTARRQPGSATT
jgi:aspartate/methionine/tyrosine aminotransferase